MSVTAGAAAAAPYLLAVLDDPEVQDAFRRAASAGRQTYRRARGKSLRTAVEDKRLRRRAQQTAAACWQLIAAIDAAQAPRKRRRGRRTVLVLAVLAGGGYGAYLVSNADGREVLRNLINHDASYQSSTAQ